MTTMYCSGLSRDGYPGYNAHPGYANPYIRQTPFEEALFSPPRCGIHDQTYLTLGGYRLALLIRRFSETGVITADCSLDYGFEQAAWCHPHGWGGRASEAVDDRCPHQRLAAWITRLHEAES